MVQGGRDALIEFVAELQRLRELAGSPSLNKLVALTADLERPLPRSTISDKLNAKSLPEWHFVVSFTTACQVYAGLIGRSLPDQLVDPGYWDGRHLRMLRMVDRTRADERLVAAAQAEISRRAGRMAPPTRPVDGPGVVPHQLPAAVRHFAGRAAELTDLTDRANEAGAAPGGAMVILAIEGTAGVGKTSLALHWAHRVAHRFPDGQLHVNLRGYDPTGPAMPPEEALYRFLEALAVPPQQIPATLDGRAALYRSVLAGKRVLIVLDNANDADQVRPLLPGTPGCVVVVTSRTQLASLVATEGAHWVPLGLLPPADAERLLESRLGGDRLRGERPAVQEIISGCAGLPLALSIVAARAATHPGHPLATLAAELRGAGDRLDAWNGGSPATDVRSVFSWSYRKLTPAAAALFRLLGLHPGPDIAIPAAASLAGVEPGEVRRLLAELTQANLISEPGPGRYTCHDLLRIYAIELAHREDAETDRNEAVRRLLDHYLHTAHAATLLLDAHRSDPVTPTPGAPGVVLADIADHEQALSWFSAEQPVLLAAITAAGASGFDTHTYQLVRNLAIFLARQGRWPEYVLAQRAGLAAALRLSDRPGQAHAHRGLGMGAAELGQYAEASQHLHAALELFHAIGDHAGAAQTHLGLSREIDRQGRHRESLNHARQALNLYQTIDHRVGQANALNSIGWCHGQLGEYHQARTACEQALELVQQLGDRWVEAAVWDSLGFAHHHLGDHTQAAACYEQAAKLCRYLGARDNEAETLIHLGDNQYAIGNHPAARAAWQEALNLRLETNHPDAAEAEARLRQLGVG
jgi:tetratricopeptide (TPR) repeat protein